jgi:hypothetical protein
MATSIYFPKFGTPIIAGDRIVFSGPGMQPRRLICIEAQGGKKLWDITRVILNEPDIEDPD